MLSVESLDKLLHIDFWPAFTIALLPALIFMFAAPDLLPAKIVRVMQWTAIAWYSLFAALTLAVAVYRGFTHTDAFFLCFILIGAWPCLLAACRLRSATRGLPLTRYSPSAALFEDRNAQQLEAVPGGSRATFRASRKKALLLLSGSLCFVALGVWASSEMPWVGWGSAAFFGLGVPMSLLMLLPGAVYLTLDTEGFELGTFFRKHRTNWSDVVRFEIGAIGTNRMIAISFTQGYEQQQFSRALASSLAGMEGAIPNSYDAPLEEILAALNSWKSRFSRTEP